MFRGAFTCCTFERQLMVDDGRFGSQTNPENQEGRSRERPFWFQPSKKTYQIFTR